MILHAKIKSFSLIEIIFAVLLIVIVSSIAVPKLFNYLLQSSIINLKTEVIIIQNAINTYNSKFIFKNESSDLTTLEENNMPLFSNIIPNNTSTKWTKSSSTSYNYKLNESNNLIFTFNQTNYSFTCNNTIKLCQEVLN